MKAVYTALKTRFFANPTLRRVGRDLVVGLLEKEKLNVVRPYTEVNLTRERGLDAFDADIDEWKCVFKYHAKDLRTQAAFDWMEAMRTTYKDGNITSPEFSCSGMSLTSTEGPQESDGSFDARATFMLTVQRTVRNPVEVRT